MVINHSRSDVLSKWSTEGEPVKLATEWVSSRLQKLKTKATCKAALEESGKLGTDRGEMKIVTNCSRRRMVTHPLPLWFLKTRPALRLLLTVNSPGCLAGKMPQHSSVRGKYLRRQRRKREAHQYFSTRDNKKEATAFMLTFLCHYSQRDLCSLMLQGMYARGLTGRDKKPTEKLLVHSLVTQDAKLLMQK